MADLEAYLESERQDVAANWSSWLNGLSYQYPVSWLFQVVRIAFVQKAAKQANQGRMTPQSYAVSILQRWVGDMAKKGHPVDGKDALFDLKPWIDDAVKKSDAAASRDASHGATPAPPEPVFTEDEIREYREQMARDAEHFEKERCA